MLRCLVQSIYSGEKMTPHSVEHWREIKSLYQRLLELSPSEREAILRSEDHDMKLKDEVRLLIELTERDPDNTSHTIEASTLEFEADSDSIDPELRQLIRIVRRLQQAKRAQIGVDANISEPD